MDANRARREHRSMTKTYRSGRDGKPFPQHSRYSHDVDKAQTTAHPHHRIIVMHELERELLEILQTRDIDEPKPAPTQILRELNIEWHTRGQDGPEPTKSKRIRETSRKACYRHVTACHDSYDAPGVNPTQSVTDERNILR